MKKSHCREGTPSFQEITRVLSRDDFIRMEHDEYLRPDFGL